MSEHISEPLESLDLAGGKLHVYKRGESAAWQCSTFLSGCNHRVSTKQRDLNRAKEFAEEWYLALRVKSRAGEMGGGHSFAAAAKKFQDEYAILTAGERSPKYVLNSSSRIKRHLTPFFGRMDVADITSQTVQDYRVHRMTKPQWVKEQEERDAREAKEAASKGLAFKPHKPWTPPSRSTMHQEIVTLRLVLKTAQRLGWITGLPDLAPPYRASSKISHRAWFSPKEYKQLYEATRARAENPPQPRWKWEYEQFHDFVLFMVNTGLRPDEALRLEFRDVEIVEDDATGETILVISVRGKRGTGYCKSMPNAVLPFTRLSQRKRMASAAPHDSKGGSVKEGKKVEADLVLPKPTDRLFPKLRHEILNSVLTDLDLKTDREGRPRTAYSLRHTYICLRLMEGADIYQIAKNCRTSVEMIEKFYAAHLKTTIDAAAVNVRKERPNGAPPKREANAQSARKAPRGGYPKRRG